MKLSPQTSIKYQRKLQNKHFMTSVFKGGTQVSQLNFFLCSFSEKVFLFFCMFITLKFLYISRHSWQQLLFGVNSSKHPFTIYEIWIIFTWISLPCKLANFFSPHFSVYPFLEYTHVIVVCFRHFVCQVLAQQHT